MANGNSNNMQTNQRSGNRGTNQKTVTVLHDFDGPILEVGVEEFMLRQPDGTITFYRKSDNLRLVCGLEWNPGFLTSNPPIFVGICPLCRKYSLVGLHVRKPTHGVTSLARAKQCTCGMLCCPVHRRRSPWDSRWRCLPCFRRHVVYQIIKSIFVRR